MSLLDPIPRAMFGRLVTHTGWFAFCPVYLGDIDGPQPLVIERNGVPQWLLSAAHLFQALCMSVIGAIAPEYQPHYMLYVTGELSPRID